MAIEIDDELAGGQDVLDVADVVQRGVGAEALRVRHRERFPVAAMEVDADFFALR